MSHRSRNPSAALRDPSAIRHQGMTMRHSIIVARIAVREDVPSPSNKEGADIAALPALCATKIELHRSIRKEGVGLGGTCTTPRRRTSLGRSTFQLAPSLASGRLVARVRSVGPIAQYRDQEGSLKRVSERRSPGRRFERRRRSASVRRASPPAPSSPRATSGASAHLPAETKLCARAHDRSRARISRTASSASPQSDARRSAPT